MTVRRNHRNRNPHGHSDSGNPPDGPGPLLTLRAAYIFTAALIIAATAGLLTYLMAGKVPAAFLAAATAFAATITLLNAIVRL